MENGDYFQLEFDIQAEPGTAEIDSFFDWAKNQERRLVKLENGTELMRMRNKSGHQILLVRPDEEHKAMSYQPEIGKHMLLETHVVAPDNKPWVLSWIPGKEVSVNELVLSFYEDVGYLLSLPTGELSHGTFPVPEATMDEFRKIYDEEFQVISWE